MYVALAPRWAEVPLSGMQKGGGGRGKQHLDPQDRWSYLEREQEEDPGPGDSKFRDGLKGKRLSREGQRGGGEPERAWGEGVVSCALREREVGSGGLPFSPKFSNVLAH